MLPDRVSNPGPLTYESDALPIALCGPARMLKGEKEDDIVEYLKEQGVVACKRFTIKKDHETVQTNTLLLTFKSVSVPKSLKIFYRIVPVDVYVPNPLRCFNCQRFGHHETNCPVDIGSVCEKCGAGGHDHLTSACKNVPKCVNCGKDHLSRSTQWLVGCFGFNGPLRQYFSLYRVISQREGEEKRIER